MAHLRNFDLLAIFQTAWQLDFLGQDLTLDTDAFTFGAEDLGNAASAFTLWTPLLYVVIANDTATTTALIAFARLGPRLGPRALTSMANYSLV